MMQVTRAPLLGLGFTVYGLGFRVRLVCVVGFWRGNREQEKI